MNLFFRTRVHEYTVWTGDKKYVGQNLGLYGVGINYLSDEDSFKWCSDGWFNEAQYMTNANVKSYYPTS